MGRSHTPVSRLNPLSATKSATRTASQTTKAVITRYDLASVYAFPWASNASRDIPRAVERLPISMPWISSWRAIQRPGIRAPDAERPKERRREDRQGREEGSPQEPNPREVHDERDQGEDEDGEEQDDRILVPLAAHPISARHIAQAVR